MRILKPDGWLYFREPVSDFALWRWIRAVVYRLPPMLDHETERPLLYDETAPVLSASGLSLRHWTTHGFLGFCLFMNSDVLVFNRLVPLHSRHPRDSPPRGADRRRMPLATPPAPSGPSGRRRRAQGTKVTPCIS